MQVQPHGPMFPVPYLVAPNGGGAHVGFGGPFLPPAGPASVPFYHGGMPAAPAAGPGPASSMKDASREAIEATRRKTAAGQENRWQMRERMRTILTEVCVRGIFVCP